MRGRAKGCRGSARHSLSPSIRTIFGSNPILTAIVIQTIFLSTAHGQSSPTPATMISPAPGSKLTSTTVTFQWSAASGATEYLLDLSGQCDEGQGVEPGTSTSATVSGLDGNGQLINVSLYTDFNGTWAVENYQYYAVGEGTPGTMTSPAPGSTLPGSNVTFAWTPGTGICQYQIQVGTTPGSGDIESGYTSGASITYDNIPTNGGNVYVTLLSLSGSTWLSNSYQYIALGSGTPASMVSPAAGSTLQGTSANFSWDAGSGISEYALSVGSTPGARDIAYTETASLDASVNNLPTNGETLYVTLGSLNGVKWLSNNVTYVASGTGVAARMTSPAPLLKLVGNSAKFEWTKGVGITGYTLDIGSSPGTANIDHFVSNGTSATVTNLPANGEALYVTLASLNGDTPLARDYIYYASGRGKAATMTSPAPGTKFFNADATFTWSKGTGIDEYLLAIGTAPGLGNIASVPEGEATSASLTNLPTTGKPFYVTLRSLNGNTWLSNSYIYNAAAPVTIQTNSLHFGAQGVGMTAPGQTVVLANTSKITPATVAASVVGKSFTEFNNCPAPGGSLAPGASCSCNVFFAPVAAGKQTGSVVITGTAASGNYSARIGLIGSGVAQFIQILPSPAPPDLVWPTVFSADVSGFTDTSVNWSVGSYPGGNTSVGTMNSAGVYFPPSFVANGPNDTQSELITATSTAKPTLSASVNVTVADPFYFPPQPALYPSSATVEEGKTLQIASWFSGASAWAVDGIIDGNAAVGRIKDISQSPYSANSVLLYTAPAKVSSPKEVQVSSVSSYEAPIAVSITVMSSAAISIQSLDKTSLRPYQLLTISGRGFNPEADLGITFSNGSGFSITVPPVSVSAKSVVVGVPPYFNSSGSLASGTVSIHVTEKVDGASSNSNAIGGFLIQEPPTSTLPPGTVTVNYLNGLANGITNLQSLIAEGAGGNITVTNIITGSLQFAEFNNALSLEANALNALTPQIAGVTSGSISSFQLAQKRGGGTVAVTAADLAVTDRLILAMISAQTGSTFSSASGDPPACPDYAGAAAYEALSTPGAITTSAQVSQYFGGAFTQCRAEAVVGGLETTGAALATGIAALAVLGAPAVGVSAGAAGVMTFSAGSAAGLAAIGGYIGRGSENDRALVQGAAGQLERFIETPVLEGVAILAEEGSEALYESYNLLHLLADSLELIHAVNDEGPLGGQSSGIASPYYGGPMATSSLTASISGSGTGNIVSIPGGIICGSDFEACTGAFPPDQTVYLDGQPDPGSSVPTLTGACSGSGICKFTTGSSQSAAASFTETGGGGPSGTPLQIPTSLFGIDFGGCVEPASVNNGNKKSSLVVAQKLVALGGSPISGYTWMLTPGSVYPPGTTVDPLTGIFHSTGGDLVPGSYTFSMTVTDGSGSTATGVYEYGVTSAGQCPVPAFPFDEDEGGNTISGPNAFMGDSYGLALPLLVGYSGTGIYASGGEAGGGLNLPLTWSVSSGSLPPGLVVDQARGVVWGEPVSGNGKKFTVQFKVKNSAGQTATCSAGSCPSFAITVR
jgi:hypothetical protein